MRAGTFAARYMPPEARGAALGMSWDELRRARPKVRYDSLPGVHGPMVVVSEGVARLPGIEYYFSRPDDAERAEPRPVPDGRLAAVLVFAPTARQRWMGARWDSIAGQPTGRFFCRTDCDSCGVVTVSVWKRDDATLLLGTTEQMPEGEYAVVQSPNLPPFGNTWLTDTTRGRRCEPQ